MEYLCTTNAQHLLSQPDTNVQYVRVCLGGASSQSDRNNILRQYEQREFDKELRQRPSHTMLNDAGIQNQSATNLANAAALITNHGASASSRRTTVR